MLGPEGSSRKLLSIGRAVGSLMSDPLFCQLTAYKAQHTRDLVAGLDTYITELTVMPPSWDQNIRPVFSTSMSRSGPRNCYASSLMP